MITVDNTWDISPNVKIYNGAGLSAKKITGRINPNATNCTYNNLKLFWSDFNDIFEMGGMVKEIYFTAKSEDVYEY